MSIGIEGLAAQALVPAGGAGSPGQANPMDASRFSQALQAAGAGSGGALAPAQASMSAGSLPQAAMGPQAVATIERSDGARSLLSALENLNGRADSIKEMTAKFTGDGAEMTPSDMLQVTVRAHELLFHCELTSNVANRSSDGIQQLFRQQS